MLIDAVDIHIEAGHGGAGKVSFDGRGPDGGNGGRGGHILINVTPDLKALNQFSVNCVVKAEDGFSGTNRRSHGRKGQDTVLHLPIGTTLTDKKTGEIFALDNLDQHFIICHGGIGGRGNLEFKTSRNRSPNHAQPGRPGQTRDLEIILRFIADFGLIGLPNAGKSSLLNQLTNAKAQIGAYPFTTLEANLGAFGSQVIADIPGLIEGASTGKGLGTNFLKHIEKVKILLHCISVESDDTLADFQTVNQELEKYNPVLLTKPRLILLTKIDLVDPKVIAKKVKQLKSLNFPVIPVSVFDPETLEPVRQDLQSTSKS